MNTVDTLNRATAILKIISEQLKEVRGQNEVLRQQVEDLQIRNTNLHVASVTKPPPIAYKLHDEYIGVEYYCDLDADKYTAIKDLYTFLDGDHSQIPKAVVQDIKLFEERENVKF